MVGGFYTYDNRTETKDLGTLCSGRATRAACCCAKPSWTTPARWNWSSTAKDARQQHPGRQPASGSRSQGELWFGGDNHDRIDVLPEKKRYQPGETARLQVRMPFRFATALVAVEREGMIDTRVVQLHGQDPTVELKIEDGWGAQRVRERAGAARPPARGAVVQLLHLGLEGAARVVDAPSGTRAANTWRPPRWSI